MAVTILSPAPDDGFDNEQILQLAEIFARQPQLGELIARRLREHSTLIVEEFPTLHTLKQQRREETPQ